MPWRGGGGGGGGGGRDEYARYVLRGCSPEYWDELGDVGRSPVLLVRLIVCLPCVLAPFPLSRFVGLWASTLFCHSEISLLRLPACLCRAGSTSAAANGKLSPGILARPPFLPASFFDSVALDGISLSASESSSGTSRPASVHTLARILSMSAQAFRHLFKPRARSLS